MTGVQQWMRNRRTAGVAALAAPALAFGVGVLVVGAVVLLSAAVAGAGPAQTPVDEPIKCVIKGVEVLWVPVGAGEETVQLAFETDMPQEWIDRYIAEARKEAEAGNCRLARWVPPGRCVPDSGAAGARAAVPSPQGAPPGDCWGAYPTGSYNITYDQGEFFDFAPKIWGFLTALTFNISRWAMQAALWVVGAGFQFDITQYTDLVDSIAGHYDLYLVGPWQLRDIAWFALFAYVAVTILRRRHGVAGGEVVLSMLMATLAAVLVSNRVDYMNAVVNFMDEASTSLLVAAQDGSTDTTRGDADAEDGPTGPRCAGNEDEEEDPTDLTRGDADEAVRGFQCLLHRQFVEEPYYIVNWGEIPDDVCRERADFILSVGLADDGVWSERYMRDENSNGEGADDERGVCGHLVRWNHHPTPERFLTALLTTATGVVMAVLLGLTGITLFFGKLVVAGMFAVVPFAAAVAVLPGAGRRLAWGWLAVTGQAVLIFTGAAAVLSVGGLAITSVMAEVPGHDRWGRTLLIAAVVMLLFVVRRWVLTRSQTAVTTFSDHMTRLSPASASWQGGTAGFDATSMGRGIGGGAKAVAGYGLQHGPLFALAGAGALHAIWGRRASAQRALKNLRKMERYKEDVGSTTPNPAGMPFSQRRRRRVMRRMGIPIPGRRSSLAPRPSPVPPPGPGPGPTSGPPPGPGSAPSPSTPGILRDWVGPRAAGFMHRTRLDTARSAIVGAYDATRRGVAHAYNTTTDRAERRWKRRQDSQADVYHPGMVREYWGDRRDIYRKFRTDKAELRQQARKGGRRVTVDESRRAHEAYVKTLRYHREVWKQRSGQRTAQEKSRTRAVRRGRPRPLREWPKVPGI